MLAPSRPEIGSCRRLHPIRGPSASDGNRRPFLGQRQGNGPADAPSAACDQGNAALQFRHVILPYKNNHPLQVGDDAVYRSSSFRISPARFLVELRGSHHFAAVDYFLLAVGNLGVAIAAKFLFRERLGMVTVGVQCQHHRCAFLHDSYSRMTAAVDTPLVSFRQAKPAFQIQVVARPIAAVSASKKARFETGHHTPHLLAGWIFVSRQLAPQHPEQPLPFRTTVRRRVQQHIHFTNRDDIRGHLFLRRRHQGPSLVDATR